MRTAGLRSLPRARAALLALLLSLAAAGCALPGRATGLPPLGPPLPATADVPPAAVTPAAGEAPAPRGGTRGVVSLFAWAPTLDARAFAEGGSRSTEGSPRVGAAGVAGIVLLDGWAIGFDSATVFLPTDPNLSGSQVVSGASTRYRRFRLVAGPRLLEVPGPEAWARGGTRPPPRLRVDALAGVRLHDLAVLDADLGTGTRVDLRERWADPVAGFRAEGALRRGVSLRLEGDSALGRTGSDHAWRASGALVLGSPEGVGIALGWETYSLDFRRGRGPDFVRLDMRLGGPFLALEVRF